MSRKTRAFRVFLHQNQNPTVKQAWDAAWKRAQKIFHARSMQDMEEKLAAAQAEIEALRKDAERYRWLRLGAHDDSDLDRWEHVGYVCGVSVCTDYGVQQTLYAEDLDAAIDAELAKVGAA